VNGFVARPGEVLTYFDGQRITVSAPGASHWRVGAARIAGSRVDVRVDDDLEIYPEFAASN
jgi:hypothetical protein